MMRRGGAPKEPAGEITFHEQLGQHDVSVARVIHPEGFVDWVMNYLKGQGVEDAQIPEGFTDIIEVYLEDGYTWFAFDVVDIGTEPGSLNPLRYTFNSDHLYYPLKITSLAKGHTQVDVIVITPKLLSEFTSLPTERVRLMHSPFSITHDEIKYIDEGLAAIFDGDEKNLVRIWRIEGEIEDFSKYDLIAR